MIRILFSSVVAAVLSLSSTQVSHTDTLFSDEIRAHLDAFLEDYIKCDMKEARTAALTQNEDGSWSSVDYADKHFGSWKAAAHGRRFKILARAWHETGDSLYLRAAKKALKFWADSGIVAPNWWYNEIGVPREFGPALILIMDSLTPEEIGMAVKILSKARFKMTGQNKIWLAEGVMERAWLQGNADLVRQARDTIASEIRISEGKEGIQPDWSFHQHGPQLQWGNYGMSYASVLSYLTLLFEDTPLAFSESQRSLIENYILNGVCVPVWKGYYDMNACGRQIDRGSQKIKARSASGAASRMSLKPQPFTGGRYYPYSDFAVYCTADWYASLRMESVRTIGMEQTCKENMGGRFAADGALLVRRDGDEYEDVAAAWNWHHVPGVTCHDDGKPIFGWNVPENKRYNLSDKVFGLAEDDYMACAMELRRDGLEARKAWFFTPRGIVCLGCGISMDSDERVVTGVAQIRLKGPVENRRGAYSCGGISFLPLDCKILQAPLHHEGDWEVIRPGSGGKKSEMDLLDLYIDHGVRPDGASYAYAVCPCGGGLRESSGFARSVRIIENSPECQKVTIDGNAFSVDWEKCRITLP